MPNVLHVRLIASLPNRIEWVRKLNRLPAKEAARFATGNDRGQWRYMKAHFHTRAHDDLLYHLVINTGRIPCPDAAQLIAGEARRCFQRGAGAKR